jgi:glucose/arabinose dehydrogenase
MTHVKGPRRAIGIAAAAAACALTMTAASARQAPVRKSYPVVRDMRGVVPPGPRVPPYNSPPLGKGPWRFESYEQRAIAVSVVAAGLSHPWSLAFLPGGDMTSPSPATRSCAGRGTAAR